LIRDGRRRQLNRKDAPEYLSKILATLEYLYPGARTALNFASPFQLLVATILSARCSDRQVNKITSSLFQKYKTPEDFAALNPGQLEEEIKSCGLYRNKSKNIIAASKMLVEKYGAQLPDSLDELKKLPGVGRKTANVVLNVIYNQRRCRLIHMFFALPGDWV
jgi:endonuclease-3